MYVGEACSKSVAVADRTTSVAAAARHMRDYHVGSVVIAEPDGESGEVRPLGIITDRDLVMDVLAAGLPADRVTLGDIMDEGLLTAEETDDLFETLERMRDSGIRRMPVIDGAGQLSGILAVDDVLEHLVAALGQIPQLIRREQQTEAVRRV